MRPNYLDNTGQVCYFLINPGGGYVDGDTYRMEITVEEEAELLLTTQSATKVYRTPTITCCSGDRIYFEKKQRTGIHTGSFDWLSGCKIQAKKRDQNGARFNSCLLRYVDTRLVA